jgi:hypothetical protein
VSGDFLLDVFKSSAAGRISYPKSVSITRIAGLPPEAQTVEARTIELVGEELDGLVEQYRKQFGVVVGTDLARELFAEYTASLQSRLDFALAVQRSAAYVADAVYERILSGSVIGDALLTAGGTGAGKTTAIRTSSQTKGLISEAAIVYDSNFNSLGSARAKVTLALEAGLRVIVIFVHRHPVEAYLQGVLPRALGEGRTVSIEGHLRMHRDSLKTFLRCQRVFADNPQAAFLVLNNTGHEAEAFPSDIAYLKSVQYPKEELFHAIKEGLDHAYRQGQISEALYTASCGHASGSPNQP